MAAADAAAAPEQDEPAGGSAAGHGAATAAKETFYSTGQKALMDMPKGDGMAYYPSGRVAVCVNHVVDRGLVGNLSFCYSDDGKMTNLLHFNVLGVGYALETSSGRKLITTEKGCKLFLREGPMEKRWTWDESTKHPLDLRVSEHLTLRLRSRTDIALEFKCHEVSKTYQVGLQPRRKTTYLQTLKRDALGRLKCTRELQLQKQAHANSLHTTGGHRDISSAVDMSDLEGTKQELGDLLDTLNGRHLELTHTHIDPKSKPARREHTDPVNPMADEADRAEFLRTLTADKLIFNGREQHKDIHQGEHYEECDWLRSSKFDDVVNGSGNKDKLVVIVCLADWAPQSESAEMLVKAVQGELTRTEEQDMVIYKFDMSDSRMLLERHNLRTCPAVIMYHNGNLVLLSHLESSRKILGYTRRPCRVLICDYATTARAYKSQRRMEHAIKLMLADSCLAISPDATRAICKQYSFGVVLIDDEMSEAEQSQAMGCAKWREGGGADTYSILLAKDAKGASPRFTAALQKPVKSRELEAALKKAFKIQYDKSTVTRHRGVSRCDLVSMMKKALGDAKQGVYLKPDFKLGDNSADISACKEAVEEAVQELQAIASQLNG